MRVPDPRAARWMLWGWIAAAALWFAVGPAPFVGDSPRLVGGACLLAPQDAGPPCPCARWPGALRLLDGQRVPLDTALARDLEAVPGIGPARARAILLEREARGRFASVDALVHVHGIGVKTVERMRPYLTASDGKCLGGARGLG